MATVSRRAIWIGGQTLQIEERPVPEPGPGEVRVRVSACGVCLTEVHTVDGLIARARPPSPIGHEYGGIVEALGPGVDGPAVGTPVACAGRGWGGFAEHVILEPARLIPLPPGVPIEHAAFVEPLVCCLSAVRRAELRPSTTVLITGAGPMGLLLLQVARRSGAVRTLVTEPNEQRRRLALRLGADAAIDPGATSVREAATVLAGGDGVDVAFETAGAPAPLRDCLEATATGGKVVLIGVHPLAATLELDLFPFHFRNLSLVASYGGMAGVSFDLAARWLGQLDLAALISHRFALDEIAEAFDVARHGRGLKVLVLL